MKKKKEIEIPKNKYIYQRYDGIITKYIVDNEYYIAVETGIATKKDETVLLGKVAENIIDLIEVGDIIEYIEQTEGKDGTILGEVYAQKIVNIEELDAVKEDIKNNGIKLLSILTKEQYMQNCYKIDTN